MILPTPKYFVLDNNGHLHGYDREDILKCDLASNKANPPKQIFRLNETGLTITYEPIAATALTITNSTPTSAEPVAKTIPLRAAA